MNTGAKKYNMAILLGVLMVGIVLITGCAQELEEESIIKQPVAEKQSIKESTNEQPVVEKQPVEKSTIEQPVAEKQPVKKPSIKQSVAQLIVGKWEIAQNKRALTGSITFDNNGRYEMNEKLHDGSGIGKKGEYKLNSDVKPIQIDLCLDKCGQPGSEWTTNFGIIRVLSNEELEIYTSPSDKHPLDFPDDTSGEYSMMLTKAE